MQGAGDLPRPTGHRHQEGEVPPEGPQKPEPEGGQPRKLTVGGQKIPKNFLFNIIFCLVCLQVTGLSCFSAAVLAWALELGMKEWREIEV